MDLKRSDFVAMGCIAAGVVFPFALMNVVSPMVSRAATASATYSFQALEACEVEEESANPRVVVVMRRGESASEVEAQIRVTRDVMRARLLAEELRFRAAREQLHALKERLESEKATLHLAVIEAKEQTESDAARALLLEEELRALERQIEAERIAEAKIIEVDVGERYQVVMEHLEQAFEAQVELLAADDQHKRKKRRKRRRHPC